jgi:leader peptidase (prepilin peptidase) / N-methyltransferase
MESIALLSYLRRRGRCFHCGTRRSLRYPFLELLTAFFCVASFTHFGITGRAFVGAVFCALLVVLAAIDAERGLIPNAMVLPGAAVILVGNLSAAPGRSVEWVAAAVASGFAFLALALVYRGALGMGDVKLALLLGAGLGKMALVAFLVGLGASSVVALAIVATRGFGARKETIPLAPFLAFGGIVALLASSY